MFTSAGNGIKTVSALYQNLTVGDINNTCESLISIHSCLHIYYLFRKMGKGGQKRLAFITRQNPSEKTTQAPVNEYVDPRNPLLARFNFSFIMDQQLHSLQGVE